MEMQKYIGVKVIKATPMNKLDYNVLRGWKLPDDESPDEEGYLVEYLDGGKPCHPDFENYISWSPKDIFEDAYKLTNGMSFGLAVEALKKGFKVTRNGWNGKNMFLFLVPGSEFKVNRPPLLGIYPEGTEIKYQPHIDMKTAQDTVVPWLASQSDILSEDWCIVD